MKDGDETGTSFHKSSKTGKPQLGLMASNKKL